MRVLSSSTSRALHALLGLLVVVGTVCGSRTRIIPQSSLPLRPPLKAVISSARAPTLTHANTREGRPLPAERATQQHSGLFSGAIGQGWANAAHANEHLGPSLLSKQIPAEPSLGASPHVQRPAAGRSFAALSAGLLGLLLLGFTNTQVRRHAAAFGASLSTLTSKSWQGTRPIPPASATRHVGVAKRAAEADASKAVPIGNIFDVLRQAQGQGAGGVRIGGGPFGSPEQRSPEEQAKAELILKNIQDFQMKPREVKAYLDRFVVEQDDAKKVLAVALCDHYNWARSCINDPEMRGKSYVKPNILISGPTGSGKTYLVRTLAKMLGVPFVKADATKFSETGIVGEDAEDVVRQLVDQAGGSNDVAQYGMVYVDEIDKVASGGDSGSRGAWSGTQVQSNFLKIMEDSEVNAKSQLANMFGGDQQKISTKFVLFIFSGAFNNMNELIKNRVGTKSMGFLMEDEPASGESNSVPTEKDETSYLHLAETKDFVDAGLEPEFVGRVPVRVAIRPLNANDLFRILTEAEDSILKQFQAEFSRYGIELKAESEALRRVAALAVEEKTGARALVTVLEKALRNFKFELPSTSCSELTLTTELLDNPQKVLEAILSSPSLISLDVQRWLAEVEKTSDLRLELSDDVKTRIVKECTETGEAAEVVLNRRLEKTGVIRGFKAIRDATDGKAELFLINEDMIERPDEEMAKWKKGLDSMS